MAISSRALGCAALFAVSATAVAQEWTSLGPGGGSISSLLVDPALPGRVYATGYGVSVSADAGRTWAAASTGLDATARTAIRGLVADPDQPGRLYLVDYDGRMMRSDNHAQSWTATGFRFGTGAEPFGLVRFAMADVPGTTGTLLVAASNGYLYKTADGGSTFSVLSYLTSADRPAEVLMFDPADARIVLAGIGYGATGPFEGATLLRSADAGLHWNTVAGVPAIGSASDIGFVPGGPALALVNGHLHVSSDRGQNWTATDVAGTRLAIAPDSPYEAIAMHATGCERSANFLSGSQSCAAGLPADATYARFTDLVIASDGVGAYRALATGSVVGVRAMTSATATWSASNTGLSNRRVRGLALVPGSAGRMFAGRWPKDAAEDTPLFSTNDSGLHWRADLAGRADYVRSVAIDPTTAAAPASLHVFAAGLGTRTAPLQPYGIGIFRSLDGGANWSVLDQGLPPPGAAESFNQARTLKLDPRSCAAPPAVGACRQGPLNTVFVLGGGLGWRVIRSTQRGDNWVSGDNGLPRDLDTGITREAIFPIDIEFDAGNGDILLSTISVLDSGVGAPATLDSGVFRSVDGGVHWQHRSHGLPLMNGSTQTTRDVYAIAAHPRRSGVFWASTVQPGQAARIYKTLDGGANWFASGPVLDACDVRDLQVDMSAPDVILAAGIGVGFASACVYRSEDGGDNWTPVVGNAPVAEIYDVRWDEHGQSRLILTTEKGVWQLNAPSDKIFVERFGD